MKIEYLGKTRSLVAEVADDDVRISVGLAGTNLAVVDMHLSREEAGAWAMELLESLT